MYKIYINETPLFLTSEKDSKSIDIKNKNHIRARYTRKKKGLFGYIDLLEKNNRFDAIIIYDEDVKRLYKDFKSIYKTIKAAGGVVNNEKGETLLIFRRNHWDLPKGKIEDGEKKKIAAIREVQEETGLQQVELIDTIGKTYHTYKNRKNRRVLKLTYWYTMQTSDSQLIPQAEEDIEEAVFVDAKSFFKQPKKVFGNIVDVLRKVDLID